MVLITRTYKNDGSLQESTSFLGKRSGGQFRKMEEAFQMLLEYKRGQAVAAEQACLHEDQVEHEGFYVCTQCGLVLDHVFQPEVNWTSRCVIAKSYTPHDSLQAVDKHLSAFMEKTGIRAPLHPIQERLRFMKMQSGYKSLNYALPWRAFSKMTLKRKRALLPIYPKATWLGHEAADC